MAAPLPKPITITQITTANYDGAAEPQPYVIVGAGNVGQAGLITKQSGIANEGTASATDLATAIALVNALKTKLNATLAALRAAGVITT